MLKRALKNLSDSPGYPQEITLSYHVNSTTASGPYQCKVALAFDHVKPGRMEGTLECIEGCTTTHPSAYMLFSGGAWVAPGDEIFGS